MVWVRHWIGRLRLLFPVLIVAAQLLAAVQPVAAQPITLNPDGGVAADDGLRIVFDGVKTNVYRNGKFQVWDGWITPIMQVTDGTTTYCIASHFECGSNGNPQSLFWTLDSMTQIDDYQVQRVLIYDLTDVGRFAVTVDYRYVSPASYIDVRMNVDVPDGYDAPVPLYLTLDTSLDENDYGPGADELWWGKRTLVQYNDTAATGLRQSGTPWDSAIQGYVQCPWGFLNTVSCTMMYDNGAETGPFYGAPYPSPTYIDSSSSNDAAVGAHWDLTDSATRTVTTQLFFSSRAEFDAHIGPDLNPDEKSPWPEDYPQEPEATPVPDCTTLPDMAVSPELIELAAGGSAQIEVALRNLCPDTVFRGADLLVSLSDGISVSGGSAGLLNLGGRAAWQNLSLNPGETRRFTLDVTAPGAVPVGPQHITELYYAGTAAKRIDGVFITAAPAAVEPTVAPAVVEVLVVPAVVEPPTLPTALPNTAAGGALPFGLLTALGAAAAGAALVLRRRS